MNFYWQIVGIFLSLSLHFFFKSLLSAYSAMSKMHFKRIKDFQRKWIDDDFRHETKYNFDVILLTSILIFVFIFPLP